MDRGSKWFIAAIAVLYFCGVGSLCLLPSHGQGPRPVRTINKAKKQAAPKPVSRTFKVIRVSDGDTMSVDLGEFIGPTEVRLWGMDAPEIEHPAMFGKPARPGQPWGIEARDALRDLVKRSGGKVILQKVERDAYGRLVCKANVRLLETNKLVGVAHWMILHGHAWWGSDYAPDEKTLAGAQADAIKQESGIWSYGPNPEKPKAFRDRINGKTK
jgi:endonuclease YncB( thermonuclease family)